jgi:hypothetical protein
MKIRFAMLAAACLLSLQVLGCTAAEPQEAPDYGRLSLRLRQGMSEQDVINALGQPNNSSLSTACGRDVGTPFTCKIWVYGHFAMNSVVIYFGENPAGSWFVMAWHSGR